jgi:AraC-like DNA-binding protein
MYINRFSRKADRSHSDARFEIHTIDSFLQEMTSGNLPLDIVKEISGFTVSYHIQQRIVLEAKRRAAFEEYSMKEIAYYLGFWDPADFSKYFKNSSGTNFTDFKKEISNFC